jgi:peptidoglycan/xylan/chitin deacetylase (PgdA/CDA1 family)
MRSGLKDPVKQACLFARDIVAPFARLEEVSILCYHSVGDSADPTAVTPTELDAHLGFLRQMGHIFVSLSDIEEWRRGARALPRRAVALTFDDGYADFEAAALPILRQYKAPAAVFVIGSPESTGWRLDEEPPFLDRDAIERLRAEPLVEVGYHSRTHPNLDGLPLGKLVEEVKPPQGERYFAYPGGHYSADAVDTVKAVGYAAAYSIKPALVAKNSDQYLLPRYVMSKGMRPWELRFATTKAASWYRALWRLFI